MTGRQQSAGKVKMSFRQAMGLLLPYAWKKIREQIASVALIILYLVLFQTIILGIPVAQALVIGIGLAMVVLGLAFFMEGLMLGIMPLGESIGVKLPQKSPLPVIIVFSLILGMGVTFAEPAIGVLKAAGFSVKPWDAPLLFLLLNRYSLLLVLAVAVGVGIAVVCGMLRFMYNFSLKLFLYPLVILLLGFSLWALFDPNMVYLTGVAWDCGGVTTGPVTVPLVLALGIGVCRVVGSSGSGASGFGVVTLASLFPVLTVMSLGLPFLGKVPLPMEEGAFFADANRRKAMMLFGTEEKMIGYALQNASSQAQLGLFGGSREEMAAYLKGLASDKVKREAVFGATEGALERWAASRGSAEQKAAVFGSIEAAVAANVGAGSAGKVDFVDAGRRNSIAALQAIIPLCIFLFLVLFFILRERLHKGDEILLGLLFALIGMSLFNVGIELGLGKLGTQVGAMLPSSFKPIELTDQRKTIRDFDTEIVSTAVSPDGRRHRFFFAKDRDAYRALPFDSSGYDPYTKRYEYVPTRGPLFGAQGGILGILVILVFALIMGYGATLAEPALNALGLTVEEMTVGTFKKSLLMQTVAVGVGAGIAFGVAKIIWDIPLFYLLAPPYLAALVLTKLSTDEFVNIGWDSAGVTTGPVTVPLVLAMGLGVGGQMGVVEGFGILAMASVWPILAVLGVGLVVTGSRKTALTEADGGGKRGGA